MRNTFFTVAIVLAVLSAGLAHADMVGTYVDATLSNTTPSDAIRTDANLDTDNLWYLYQGRQFGEFGGVFNSQGGDQENCPMLTTTVSGVANGTYNVYLTYWTNGPGDWQTQAAIAGNPLVAYGMTNGTPTGKTGDPGDTQVERQALLGQVIVTTGSFSVNIDDVTGVTGDVRTWYDGVSYQSVPEPSAIALLTGGILGLLAYAWRRGR